MIIETLFSKGIYKKNYLLDVMSVLVYILIKLQ